MNDHVKRLIGSGGAADLQIDSPTWSEIDAAIRSLDGRNNSEVYLQPVLDDPESYLAVAGGSDDRYLVFVCHSNESFDEAITPGAGSATVSLTVGGQLGSLTLEQLVTLDQAIAVAREFYTKGELDAGVTWRRR